MKPTTLVIAAGVVLASLAFGAPVHAQSARIAVGAVFSGGPQYPPPPPYAGRPGPDGTAVTAVMRDTGRETTR